MKEKCEYLGHLCGNSCIYDNNRSFEEKVIHHKEKFGQFFYCIREMPDREDEDQKKQIKMQLLPF